MPLDLWKVERQVVSQEAVLGAGLLERDLRIGQRQLLEVVDLVRERVVIVLGHTGLEQMKQDLGILRIVLIPLDRAPPHPTQTPLDQRTGRTLDQNT